MGPCGLRLQRVDRRSGGHTTVVEGDTTWDTWWKDTYEPWKVRPCSWNAWTKLGHKSRTDRKAQNEEREESEREQQCRQHDWKVAR